MSVSRAGTCTYFVQKAIQTAHPARSRRATLGHSSVSLELRHAVCLVMGSRTSERVPTTNPLMGGWARQRVFSAARITRRARATMTWRKRDAAAAKEYEVLAVAWRAGREPWKVRCSQQGTPHRPPGCIAQPETYMQNYPARGTAA